MVYSVVIFQNKGHYGSIWTMTYLKWQFHTQMWWGCPLSSQKIQSHPQWTRAARLVCWLYWQVHCSRHQPHQLQRHWTLQSNVYRITQTSVPPLGPKQLKIKSYQKWCQTFSAYASSSFNGHKVSLINIHFFLLSGL